MAALLDRLRPLPTPDEPAALAALQEDRARSARAWLLAGTIGAHVASLAVQGTMGGPTLPIGIGVVLLAAWLLVTGATQAVLLVRAEPRRRGDWLALLVVVALAVLASPLAGFFIFAGGGMATHAAAVLLPIAGVVAIVVGARRRGPHRNAGAVLVGLAAALLAVALNAIDTFVLLPAALLPDRTLEETYALLAVTGGETAIGISAAICILWAVGAALVAVGLRLLREPPERALGWMLGIAAGAMLGRSTLTLLMGWPLSDLSATGGMSIADAPLWLLALALTAAASWLLLGRPRR